ncbi:MAG TPA: hypothetical protein VNA67_03985 [Pseudonocardiaceae bacterium]|nr:hypothetical protein [Pseudonocardiaceae bacterium]
MSIRVLRAVALLLAALTMGLLLAHVLELGPKFSYPPELYIQLNNSLYVWYGPPLGALLYLGAIVAAAVLTWLVRRRRAVGRRDRGDPMARRQLNAAHLARRRPRDTPGAS